MRLVLYTSGNSREIKVKNQSIFLKHVSPSILIASGTIAGTVISALRYLGQKNVTQGTLYKIKEQLTAEDFERLLKQVEYIPAWPANIFYYFQKKYSTRNRFMYARQGKKFKNPYPYCSQN